jgi:hypothetical protein
MVFSSQYKTRRWDGLWLSMTNSKTKTVSLMMHDNAHSMQISKVEETSTGIYF